MADSHTSGDRGPRAKCSFLVVVLRGRERRACTALAVSTSSILVDAAGLAESVGRVELDLHLPDGLAPIRAAAEPAGLRDGATELRLLGFSAGGRSRVARFVRERLSLTAILCEEDRAFRREQEGERIILLDCPKAGGPHRPRRDVPFYALPRIAWPVDGPRYWLLDE
jgi:hypothetical protein